MLGLELMSMIDKAHSWASQKIETACRTMRYIEKAICCPSTTIKSKSVTITVAKTSTTIYLKFFVLEHGALHL